MADFDDELIRIAPSRIISWGIEVGGTRRYARDGADADADVRKDVAMSVFTPAEIAFLQAHRVGRLATVGASGEPHVVPVAYRYNPDEDTIDIGGAFIGKSKKYRDAGRTGRAAFVVDERIEGVRRHGTCAGSRCAGGRRYTRRADKHFAGRRSGVSSVFGRGTWCRGASM